ncbi:phosphatase PAP2 family protein [Mucilaginibacter aquaedulcis]|uniref:phosphatase PAP2 family protein n=1 Tax=Mucilaginibacter aquaedulcis TaxID=1187081 RepID=UPI0025B52C92|nr:phosphatase PAP2 family protein [Mucilaginibacter aquaedulcis]MDN3547261.1 phosphatase PAP2 family protein [Mucilaginibacter aquaedulcis]
MKLIKKTYFFSLIFLFSLSVNSRLVAQSRLQQWDDRIMIDLQNQRTPEQTGIFLFLSNTHLYGDIGVPAGLLVGGIIGNDKQMRQNSLYVASSTVLTTGLTYLIKHIVKRPRPFVQNLNITPVYRAGSTSFPSGHTSSSFSTATALSRAYPKWYVIAPAFLWAGSVSYSRMYLGVHYPTDVAAGAALGVGSTFILQSLKK